MNTFAQWIHQHDFLILLGAVFSGSLILLSWFRLWTKKRLFVWSFLFGLAILFLLGLRTPSITVSEPLETAVASNTHASTNSITNKPIELNSIEEIEQYLQNGEKPTLVEFYSDFGIS